MSTEMVTHSRLGVRRAVAIASCILSVGLIVFAFGVGTKASKPAVSADGHTPAAETKGKKPARMWNIALGNVVVAAPGLGLSVKTVKAAAPDQAKLAARIEGQLQSLRDLYRQESEKDPELMGSMMLQITIEPSGEVGKVKEVASRVSNPEFRKAVASLVSEWSFADTAASGAIVNCPLLFVREGMDINTLVQWEKSLGQNGERNGGAYGYNAETPVQQSKTSENQRQSDSGPKWSPTGKPVAPSSTPAARNPEQVPPARAGARVEGSKTAAPDKTARASSVKPAPVIHQLRFATSMRKEPNFSSLSVSKLSVGAKVALLEIQGEWIEVREESTGKSGYIRREFIGSSEPERKP